MALKFFRMMITFEKMYLNTNGENVEEEEENVINPENNNS